MSSGASAPVSWGGGLGWEVARAVPGVKKSRTFESRGDDTSATGVRASSTAPDRPLPLPGVSTGTRGGPGSLGGLRRGPSRLALMVGFGTLGFWW